MRVLLTGIGGFVAAHLTARLLADGHEVFGSVRGSTAVAGAVALRLGLPADHVLTADVNNAAAIAAVVRRAQPEGLFHLAAVTSVPASLADPEQTYTTNLLGSLKVLAAVRDAASRCRILCVGSSDAYGSVEPEELPVTETQAFRPLSPYGVSKAAADLAAYQWWRAHGLDIVRLRPFSHTGPGQAPRFVCADLARQVVDVERGRSRPCVEVGNLDVVRDFTDVRDVVRAYVLAWQHGDSGAAYNVCSGTGRTPRQIIDALLGLSGVDATVVVQPARQRATDVKVLVGSAAKLQRATGWSAAIPWEETLRDLLDDWRAR